jgi:hypothetical protein
MEVIKMEQTLVKILGENDVDVTQLSEENISEYLQASNTVDLLTKLVVDPFKEHAKSMGTGEVYSSEGVTISVNESRTAKKMSDKGVLDSLERTLTTMNTMNDHGKQIEGVRRFGDTVAVDALYLSELMNQWEDISICESVKVTVTYKGKGVKKIANDGKGDLVAVGMDLKGYDLTNSGEITDAQAKVYLAACQQVKDLNKTVVSPFEAAFKDNAQSDPKRTVFDNQSYGGLIVQVKAVPRDEPQYGTIKEKLGGLLQAYSVTGEENCDQERTFFNDALTEPRTYVSIDALKSDIAEAKENTELKYRREVNVLYAPQKAIVLTKS